MGPGGGVLLDVAEQLVHPHGHGADDYQAAEGKPPLQGRANRDRPVADALVGGGHLTDGGARERQRDGDLQ